MEVTWQQSDAFVLDQFSFRWLDPHGRTRLRRPRAKAGTLKRHPVPGVRGLESPSCLRKRECSSRYSPGFKLRLQSDYDRDNTIFDCKLQPIFFQPSLRLMPSNDTSFLPKCCALTPKGHLALKTCSAHYSAPFRFVPLSNPRGYES